MWLFLLLPPPNASRSQACSRGGQRWDRVPMQEEAGRRLDSDHETRPVDGRKGHGSRRRSSTSPVVVSLSFPGLVRRFPLAPTVTPAGRTELKRTSQLRPSHRRRAGFPFRASWRPRPKGPPAGPLALHIRSDAFSVRLSYHGLQC